MNDAVPVQALPSGIARTVTICNARGLHARAAAKFVNLAGSFEAEITVAKDGVTVSGRSIMGLMMLSAGTGCCIDVQAVGPDADAALAAIASLVERGFDETRS